MLQQREPLGFKDKTAEESDFSNDADEDDLAPIFPDNAINSNLNPYEKTAKVKYEANKKTDSNQLNKLLKIK